MVRKLRRAEAWLNERQALVLVIQKVEVTEQTWRNKYGSMKADEMERLKELEEENRRFKRVVADLTWITRYLRK